MKTLLITALHGEIKTILSHFDSIKMTKLGGPTRYYECHENLSCLNIGMGPSRAKNSMTKLLGFNKPDRIIQIGVSGAIQPDLKIGDYIIPNTVFMDGAEPIVCKDTLNLDGFDVAYQEGGFWCSPHIVDTGEEKRQIYNSTNALAVDMESYPVIKACHEANISYTSLRIISDLANDSALNDFKINFIKTSNLLQEFVLQNILPKILVTI